MVSGRAPISEGLDLLYRGEELYLIRGAWAEAAQAYGQAYGVLRDALIRWGRIAIEQAVWPFSVGGHFYPYRGAPSMRTEHGWKATSSACSCAGSPPAAPIRADLT